MPDNLQSLSESLAERPDLDRSEAFVHLWETLRLARARIDARLTLVRNPQTEDLRAYADASGDYRGSLNTFSGPEVAWMVHSWIGNPRRSFTNMHLTIWLKPQTRVPHLGMALGTLPELFFYMDYVPRVDLMADLDYLDRYYQPVNDRFVHARADKRFTPFTSKDVYMRASQTATSLCYSSAPEPDTLERVRALALDHVNRWLAWLDAAEPVPESERAALAARDERVRRAIAERDPANAVAASIFGPDLADRLVRGLWGGV